MVEQGKSVTIKDLLKVLYEKACQQKLWGLVRHTAGILGKRVEDLAKAVTDLLVRQKQVNKVCFSSTKLFLISMNKFYRVYYITCRSPLACLQITNTL